MYSPLDSRYWARIKASPLADFVGERNFIKFMYYWSVAFQNVYTNSKIAPHKLSEEQVDFFSAKVNEHEITTKHQMTALIKLMNDLHPNRRFHYGLTSEDIMHNARWTQVYLCMRTLQNSELKLGLSLDSMVPVSWFALEFTHGQPATPVNLKQFLLAKLNKPLANRMATPSFRLGGSNGQNPINDNEAGRLAESWLNETTLFIEGLLGTIQTRYLTQVGPSNSHVLFCGLDYAYRYRSFARTLWDHASRGILKLKSDDGQTGSSAMPHKVNPIHFEQAEGMATLAIGQLHTLLEANTDSRGLRDLSSSVINRTICEPWVYLYLAVESLSTGLQKAAYKESALREEIYQAPECITEFVRYYGADAKDWSSEEIYAKLKNAPPMDLQSAMRNLKFNRNEYLTKLNSFLFNGGSPT